MWARRIALTVAVLNFVVAGIGWVQVFSTGGSIVGDVVFIVVSLLLTAVLTVIEARLILRYVRI